jgi:hypothetical protein
MQRLVSFLLWPGMEKLPFYLYRPAVVFVMLCLSRPCLTIFGSNKNLTARRLRVEGIRVKEETGFYQIKRVKGDIGKTKEDGKALAENTQKSTVQFRMNHHMEKNNCCEVRGFEPDEKSQKMQTGLRKDRTRFDYAQYETQT